MEELLNEELCALAQSGNGEAVEALIKKNHGFISYKARSFYKEHIQSDYSYCVDWEDLFQEASFAFWQAFFSFDPSHEVKLISYAGTCIVHTLNDYLDRYLREHRFERGLQRVESYPDPDEEDGNTVDRIKTYDDDFSMGPEPLLIEKESREEVFAAFMSLSPREKKLLRYRYGYPDDEEKTLKETAEHFSLRMSRAKREEEKALRNLRKALPW